ncbi:MAG TPA: redoxin domain-containing protein, partial [Planctomycetota bacterium]|nr:redoxin domain-containing protein [Planctomycetota bacterium]
MLKASRFAALAFALAASTAVAQQKGYAAGSTVADFTLADLDGNKQSLKGLAENKKAVVVCFWSRDCEAARASESRLAKLRADYHEKGVVFVHVVSNKKENKAEDDVKKTREQVKAKKVEWLVLLDPDNKIADAFDARVTPAFFVIDAKDLKVAYAGALTDDPWKDAKVTKEYVKDAVDAVLAGKTPATTTTKAEG